MFRPIVHDPKISRPKIRIIIAQKIKKPIKRYFPYLMDKTFSVIQRNFRVDFPHRSYFTHGADRSTCLETFKPVLEDADKSPYLRR